MGPALRTPPPCDRAGRTLPRAGTEVSPHARPSDEVTASSAEPTSSHVRVPRPAPTFDPRRARSSAAPRGRQARGTRHASRCAAATTSRWPTRPAWRRCRSPSPRTPRSPTLHRAGQHRGRHHRRHGRARPRRHRPAAALPVMEGKAVLFKHFAGIDAVPVCLRRRTSTSSSRPSSGSRRPTAASTSRTSRPRAASRSSDGCRSGWTSRSSTTTSTARRSSCSPALPNAGRVSSARTSPDLRVVVGGAGAAGVAVTRILQRAGVARRRRLRLARCRRTPTRTDLAAHKRELAATTNPRGVAGSLGDGAGRAPTCYVGVSGGTVPEAALARDGARTRSSSPWPTPTPRCTPTWPPGTPRSSRPAAATSRTRSTTCWRSRASSVAPSTPGATRITEGMKLAAAPGDRRPGRPSRAPSEIVPSVFEPGVADAVAARPPRGPRPSAAGREGRRG